MYKINDYVVYKHDVCKITDIKEIKNQNYYVMKPINDNSLTLIVPININENNLRNIISLNDANKIIDNIKYIEPLNIDDKNNEAIYKELLNEGTHENLIKIIKTTYLRNNKRINDKKKISNIDDTYFNLAEKYLYSELGIALDKTSDEIKEYIINLLSN